jgi:hypothetical protein
MTAKEPTFDDGNELPAAVAAFRHTGDAAPFLSALRLTDSPRPLLGLQRALGRATTREERDALEDLAFACAGGATPEVSTLVEEVRSLVGRTYGPHVESSVDVGAFILGVMAAFPEPPPTAAVVAAIGIAAEQVVASPLLAGPMDCGKDLQVFLVHCEICGGGSEGRGHLFCSICRQRAEELVGRFPMSLPGLEDSATDIARELLAAEPQRFGCPRCRHRPVQPCRCLREVRVPPSPRDGEILQGRHVASGDPAYFCLRLRGQ